MKKYEFKLIGLDCAHCANKIQNALAKQKELKSVNVNYAKEKLTYESETENFELIKNIINKLEPEVQILDLNSVKNKRNNKNMFLQILRLLVGLGIALLRNIYTK